ncbi:hypothetical protein [Calidithermus chliarophilus]|uniref:hypothetical protein n=1 Tax=Calidithermus chliarophilus TaxID=52023 RepID=UPI0004154895|nr:hypothetical protein [Calidithermus chliarophilus]
MENKPANAKEARLDVSREVGRGYLNGWGSILAYATVALVALLVFAGPQPRPVEVPEKKGCGCGA